jgi:hypothetical protein
LTYDLPVRLKHQQAAPSRLSSLAEDGQRCPDLIEPLSSILDASMQILGEMNSRRCQELTPDPVVNVLNNNNLGSSNRTQ